MSEFGPQVPFSDQLHAEKYRGAGESFDEAMNRIAAAMSDSDDHYKEFRDVIRNMRFLPAGRVQAAMGSSKTVTAFNCYVSGTIEDSFVDGKGSIMSRATEAAQTMRMGGGIGYDFSTLRPRNALIKKLGSKSSGPISFMEIFDSVCRCVASSGHRRGAQMGVMRIDHPDIEEFIHAKQNTERLTGFNVSVAVTDEFMNCLQKGVPFDLKFEGKVYGQVDPASLWEMLMRSTWDWGEPGVLFIDTINNMNNLRYCEMIAAANPCGEQPLPPDGACLLGSFNLVKYLKGTNPITRDCVRFDWHQFVDDIAPVVRAMDNVIDRTVYPLYEQQKEAQGKRRMGLGVTALANAGEALGFPYGSEKFLEFEARVFDTLRDVAYMASAGLAQEKGVFPRYSQCQYEVAPFIQTLHPDAREKVRKHGLRNSHLLSIAPAGTISFTADNVTSGVEPVFSYEGERLVNMPDGEIQMTVRDYGVEFLGHKGVRAKDVTIQQHLDVLITAATRVDSAVSKTLNIPHDTPWEDFKDIYFQAWSRGAKGCTTFTDGGKRAGILKSSDEPQACEFDPATGTRSCD